MWGDVGRCGEMAHLGDLAPEQEEKAREETGRDDEMEHGGGGERLGVCGGEAGGQVGAKREGAEQRGQEA